MPESSGRFRQRSEVGSATTSFKTSIEAPNLGLVGCDQRSNNVVGIGKSPRDPRISARAKTSVEPIYGAENRVEPFVEAALEQPLI